MPTPEWKKDWRLMSSVFTKDEITNITGSLKKIKIKNVVYCSMENRTAKSGGLAAVAVKTLPYLKEINKIPNIILMTPYYPKMKDITKLSATDIVFNVPYENRSVTAELYKYTDNYNKPAEGQLSEYYLKSDGFFEAEKDPYIYFKDDPEKNNEALRENSLFFCRAVPYAIKALGLSEDIIFHLQEWQTALISLTSKEATLNGTLKSCATIQTMHNPYDSQISKETLDKIIDLPRRKRMAIANGASAYQIGLGLCDAPIATVSENFAKEFTSDILQRDHFAPHLQDIFNYNGVFGINNGMFIEFPKEFPKKGKHTIPEVTEIKMNKRKELLKVLDKYKPSERFGELTYNNKSITTLPDDVPIFVMSGRLDPNQKGYDIFLQAIEKFACDEIKVVLTPMPIKKSDLDYFYEIACKCKGNLTVFPTRMEEGFMELQLGSTYGVMPSIYEPFGAAVEYMANGTVNIGRATGELVDQIENGKSGFLYREADSYYKLQHIRDYGASSDIVQIRKNNPWALSMSEALHDVLRQAIDLYQKHPDKYCKLIIKGFKEAERFTWESNARQYYELYNKVNIGF